MFLISVNEIIMFQFHKLFNTLNSNIFMIQLIAYISRLMQRVQSTQEPVPVNISVRTDIFNKSALALAWEPGNGIVPVWQREIPIETLRARQQQTYGDNEYALRVTRELLI
jgi:hypothetical protein